MTPSPIEQYPTERLVFSCALTAPAAGQLPEFLERLAAGPGGARHAVLRSGGCLSVWSEGGAEGLRAAWAAANGREGFHTQRVLHRSRGPALLGAPLQVVTLHNGDCLADVSRRLLAIERRGSAGWGVEPAAIWRDLAAPGREGCSVGMPPLRRELALVAADDGQASDLLMQAARRWSGQVSYQSYATHAGETAETGVGYADLAAANQPTRVQALSGRALQNGLIRLGLGGTQRLALALPAQPAAAAALAGDLRALLDHLGSEPAVHLYAPSAGALAAAQGVLGSTPLLAQRTGAAWRDLAAPIAELAGQARWPRPVPQFCEAVAA